MLQPPLSRAPIVEDWLQRHRHPGSFALHILGIPPTLIGVLMVPIAVAALSWPVFLFSLSLFVVGYLFQFLGHALEGSEPGELTALRAWWTRRAETAQAKAAARPSSGAV